MLRPGRVCLMYDTDHEKPILVHKAAAPQDRGEQRPLRGGLIGQGHRRGDAHIVGYYAPATGGRAKSRSPAQGGCGSSDPMRETDATSTGGWVVPAPPGVVMVAPQTLLCKAEGTQSKGRA